MSRLQSLRRSVLRTVRTLTTSDTTRSFLVALAVIGAVVAASCDKVPLTSPTGSSISLSVDKTILPVNGQATVTAVVTESSGTAVHNGTTVSFQSSIGRVEPSEAQTLNGKAVATYIAPSVSGTADIKAFSGAASTGSGNASSGGVSIKIGAAAVGSISVNVAPSSVPQVGGLVSVTARVLDAANNPLPSVAVLFSTDSGTLTSTSVVSDSNGIATTTLTANRATKVTATVGDKTGDFNIGVLSTPIVTITATTTTPTVNVPVAFTVKPGSATNSSPIQVVAVDFGDGSALASFSNPTGDFGVTHTYSRAQGYTVTATATDINGQRGVSSTAIVVTHAPLPTATITLTPATGINVNEAVSFDIVATAATGGPPVRTVRATIGGTVVYNGTGSGSFIRSFSTTGIYTVTVTVIDANGSEGSVSKSFVVEP